MNYCYTGYIIRNLRKDYPMAKKKKSFPKTNKPKPEETPKVEEFMEIGGSPASGITLHEIFNGHTEYITRVAWSPDGQYIASSSRDKSIRIWSIEHRECVKVLEGHTEL